MAVLLAVAIGVPVFAAMSDARPGTAEPPVAVGAVVEGREIADDAGSEENRSEAEGDTVAVDAAAPVAGQVFERDLEALARLREARIAELLAKRKARQEAREPEPFTVRIGTFNVLGSQHTGPGGERNFASASIRTPQAAALAAAHGVDILGTQELQADQLAGMMSRTGMAAYPGYSWGQMETDNSILYDDSVFELVETSQFTITFMSRPRPQPIIKLRHRATGSELYVVNTHTSPGGGAYLAQRRNAQATLAAVVNDLKATGLPVLITGDMNDREEFWCQVAPRAGLTAPNGGSWSGGCRPPPSPLPVDWVVGAGPVTWSNYWRDTSSVTRRISDHFFISATAHVG